MITDYQTGGQCQEKFTGKSVNLTYPNYGGNILVNK